MKICTFRHHSLPITSRPTSGIVLSMAVNQLISMLILLFRTSGVALSFCRSVGRSGFGQAVATDALCICLGSVGLYVAVQQLTDVWVARQRTATATIASPYMFWSTNIGKYFFTQYYYLLQMSKRNSYQNQIIFIYFIMHIFLATLCAPFVHPRCVFAFVTWCLTMCEVQHDHFAGCRPDSKQIGLVVSL